MQAWIGSRTSLLMEVAWISLWLEKSSAGPGIEKCGRCVKLKRQYSRVQQSGLAEPFGIAARHIWSHCVI